MVYLVVFFSSDSQCWYLKLFHHSVFVDLNFSMMMHYGVSEQLFEPNINCFLY